MLFEKIEKLKVVEVSSSEQKNHYEIEFTVVNDTGLLFDPYIVFLSLIFAEEEQKKIPLFMEASLIQVDGNIFFYNAVVPKHIFSLSDKVDKNKLKLNIRGQLLNEKYQIVYTISKEDFISLSQ